MGKSLNVTVRGETRSFESAFDTDADALKSLADSIASEKTTSSFAIDLVAKSYKGRGLSAKQMAWVHKLATEAVTPRESRDIPARPDLDLSTVIEMMDLAAAAQKRAPRIVLVAPSGQKIVLRRSGEQARVPGSVSVTDGGPFGASLYFGCVNRDGTVRPSGKFTDEVGNLLRDLAVDPAKVAGQHGIATGSCCFCAKLLSTAESRSVGYGPVCADKYGLPWGDTTAADAADAAAKATADASE